MSVTSLPVSLKPDTIVDEDVERENLNAVENFETYRSYLFSIAYRILGSVMDAEDMVQETYLHYQSASYETIHSLKAYLTTIMTRLCIDQLHLSYKQRETYIGPWLPEPIITENTATPNAEEATVMQESLSVAFLCLLEQLQPMERAVFLLREVFDYDYADIATFVGRKEVACRQLFSRAKKHLANSQRHDVVPPEVHKQLLESFLRAVQAGDQTALMELLTEDVRLVADGGGKIPGAATQAVVGSRAVAQFAIGVNLRFLPSVYHIELSEVNYQPAVIARSDGKALVVMTVEVEEGRMKMIRFMANPDKLAHL